MCIYKPPTQLPTRCQEHFCIPQIDQQPSQPNPDYLLTNVQTFCCSPFRDVKALFHDSVEVVRSLLLPFIRVLCSVFRDVVSLLQPIREIAGPAFGLNP